MAQKVALESQNPKCQDLPIFQFPAGEGGVLESQTPNFRLGCSEDFEEILPCHFLDAFASQIVSHIVRMWRLSPSKG